MQADWWAMKIIKKFSFDFQLSVPALALSSRIPLPQLPVQLSSEPRGVEIGESWIQAKGDPA